MRKNLLSFSMGTLSLGVCATVVSLGVNLAHLDTNSAQAAFANVPSDSIASGVATPDTTSVMDGATSSGNKVVGATANGGIVYASEIFGSGSNSTVLPDSGSTTEPHYAAVQYTHSGTDTIEGELLAIFTLTNGAVFADDPTLYGSNTAIGSPVKLTSGGGGKGLNFVKIKFGTGGAGGATPSQTMSDGNKLWLEYQLTSANALATAGQKIEMKFELNDVLESYSYGIVSEDLITVAQSKDAVSLSIEPNNSQEAISYRISVESGEVAFTGGDSTDDEIVLATLKIENKTSKTVLADAIFCPNGTNVFQLGSTVTGACAGVGSVSGSTVTKSAFTITGGQLAASITEGGVKLGSGAATAATDESTVTIKLSDTLLDTIATEGNTGVPVSLVVNGVDKINVPENPPLAGLNIIYTATNFQSTVLENVELPLIKLDGVTCTVYNVPPVGAADNSSIRITNKSSIAGTVVATLYDGLTGDELFTETLNGGDNIDSKATLAITPAILQELNGGTAWGGRAVLKLTSTLSDIEVMALLREVADAVNAPVTNLSTGATGNGCSN